MAASSRISSIDTLRLLAIFGVVYIHLGPYRDAAFAGTAAAFWAGVANQLFRFGVPFFFMASGYFFMAGVDKGKPAWQLWRSYAGRLLILFVVWSAAYLLAQGGLRALSQGSVAGFTGYLDTKLSRAASHPLSFVFEGTKEHLWFLPALISGLFLVTVFVTQRVSAWCAWLCVLTLYAAALAGGSYAHTPLGFVSEFNLRNGPFVSSVYVWIGACFARGHAPMRTHAVACALGGLALMLAEAVILRSEYGIPLASHDNLAGTALYGTGIFMCACAFPRLGASTPLPALGRLTLGVYVMHMLVALPFLEVQERYHVPGLEIALPVIVFAVSLAVSRAFAAFSFTRRLVS